MATSYTLLQLRQALAEEAFAGQHPIRMTTTGGGSTTTLVFADLAFGASGATANAYHGWWAYNTDSAITAPFSSRVLETGGFAPSTGTLTVAPPFGSTPGTPREIIFHGDLHPDELVRAINRVLRGMIYYAYLPVTLVQDGDMEDSGVTLWDVVAGGSRSKVAASATNPFFFGRQALQVTGGVGAGVASQSIPVQPGESLLVSAVLNTDKAVDVSVYDQVAAANIKTVRVTPSAATTSRTVELRFQANVPTTSDLVLVRVLSAAVGATIDINYISLLSQNRKRYSLDSGSVERTADIQEIYRFPWQQSSDQTDTYYPLMTPVLVSDYLIEEDIRAGSPMNIVLPRYPTEPYFMRVKRVFPELTTTAATINASTNTTFADRDTVVQGAMHYVERARYARVVGGNPQLAAVHLGRAREYARKFAMMRQAQGYGVESREVPTSRVAMAMSSHYPVPTIAGHR